jgi:beta-glucosidase
METEAREFPEGFLIGTSDSAIQSCGDPDGFTDWGRLKKRRLLGPQWSIKEVREKDLSIIRNLGFNSHRDSFEWARIEPKKGEFDDLAIERAKQDVDWEIANKLKPIRTLNHFSLPTWLADEGGWENPKIVNYFKDYASRMAKEVPQNKYWLTINEPILLIGQAYLRGEWPPKVSTYNPLRLKKIQDNLINAHNEAYGAIKSGIPDAKVSFAHYFEHFRPNSDLPWDRLTTKVANDYYINHYLHRTAKAGTLDFIGINFYRGSKVKFNPLAFKVTMHKGSEGLVKTFPFTETIIPDAHFYSSMGWPESQDYLYQGLHYLHREFGKPIMITETGLATDYDDLRTIFMIGKAMVAHQASKDGIEMLGVKYWNTVTSPELLLDDELEEVYKHDFSLISINPKMGGKLSGKVVKQSAIEMGNIARNRRISLKELEPRLSEYQSTYLHSLDQYLKTA